MSAKAECHPDGPNRVKRCVSEHQQDEEEAEAEHRLFRSCHLLFAMTSAPTIETTPTATIRMPIAVL
jgi:hypothetical protein